ADVYVRDRLKSLTTLVSVSSRGKPVEGNSSAPAISGDGRFLAFESSGPLVPGDSGFPEDIFAHDRETGQTTLVSVDFSGGPADASSFNAAVSDSGSIIAFQSYATDLVPGDSGPSFRSDVFVRDMVRGVTIKVSEPYPGATGSADGGLPDVSADGRFVVFQGESPNLVPSDTNGVTDVFRRDLLRQETVRVSLGNADQEADWHCEQASVSADGRFVAFESAAPNLSSIDAPGFVTDIFVRDMARGITELISVSSEGVPSDNPSVGPSISDDGRYVSFTSSATNLVPGLTGFLERVYRHDRMTGETVLLCPGMGGAAADSWCSNSNISGNGLVVVFESPATNLVPADFNFNIDAFAFDLTPQLVGDLNGDGVVNGLDLALLLGEWGACPDPEGICPADLDVDLVVNGFDLAILLANWTRAT
ncbi:MAG: dockerin type I domain-containing protein, partial [Myxococcota bacterium]